MIFKKYSIRGILIKESEDEVFDPLKGEMIGDIDKRFDILLLPKKMLNSDKSTTTQKDLNFEYYISCENVVPSLNDSIEIKSKVLNIQSIEPIVSLKDTFLVELK